MLGIKRRQRQTIPTGPCLSQDELAQFRQRFVALEAARSQYVMMGESWRAWAQSIAEKYGVGTLFDVNVDTGELTERERPVQEAE